MNRQRLAGVVAACMVAGPVWTILLVDPPHFAWLSASVALIHLAFAVLIAMWLTRHPRGRRWLADRGAAATWAGLGGLLAAPAIVLRMSPVVAAVALGGLALVITLLSPVLSVRAAEMLEGFLAPGPEVRPLPKLGEIGGSPSSLVRTLPPFPGGPRAA